MTKKLISAWTAPGSSYPQYINLSADGDDVVVVVRSAPETVEGVRVCGATCHPGEFGCNNYCGLCAQGTPIPDAPKSHSVLREGATATMRLPRNVLQEALEILAQPPASVSPGTKGEARSEPKASQHPIRGEGEPVWAIGSWLSAALDDPKVCAEMKRDINEWFDEGGYRRAHPPTTYGKPDAALKAADDLVAAGLIYEDEALLQDAQTVQAFLQALQSISGRTG